MLFMKLDEYHEYLKPFVVYLNFMPDFIEYEEEKIHSRHIKSEELIEEVLKEI